MRIMALTYQNRRDIFGADLVRMASNLGLSRPEV
jgi:hypothetical protein